MSCDAKRKGHRGTTEKQKQNKTIQNKTALSLSFTNPLYFSISCSFEPRREKTGLRDFQPNTFKILFVSKIPKTYFGKADLKLLEIHWLIKTMRKYLNKKSQDKMSLDAGIQVFGVSDRVGHKPVYAATEDG